MFLKIYIILYAQSKKFFEENTQLRTMIVHNFSKNVENSTHLMNSITQRIYIIFLHLKYANFQTMRKFPQDQST